MYAKKIVLLGVALSMLATSALASSNNLDAQQRSIIAIAAHTANGDLTALRSDLTDGLTAGLTVNEIKEVLVQLYAYTGFPRSLNAINLFMDVMSERQKAGIKDEIGKEASPVAANINKDQYGAQVRAKLGGRSEIPPPSGYQLFAPAIDTFLKEHLFCDIFIRDNLDSQSRELATIGALGAMHGTEGQLLFHLNAAMNTGTSPSQMKDFISVLRAEVGEDRANSTEKVLERVLQNRGSSK